MKTDRRIRRTHRVLRDALIALILEQGYEAVTVEDIIARADVARATFYNHFRDKSALLLQIARDLSVELHERTDTLALPPSKGYTGKPVLELFRHAAAERDTYRAILRGAGDGQALREFTNAEVAHALEIFTARVEYFDLTPRIDMQVLAHAWVGEQVAVLRWWLESEAFDTFTPEQLAQDLMNLSINGRYWATGFGQARSVDPID